MEDFATIFARQSDLLKEIQSININFRKDGASRKTEDYLKKRITALDNLWMEFEKNNSKLNSYEDKSYEYFANDIYNHVKEYYTNTKKLLSSYKTVEQQLTLPSFSIPQFEAFSNPMDELLSQQKTNFKAFNRLINRIKVEDMEEKWEVEDALKNLQHLWNVIDTLHLRLDTFLQGQNREYDEEFIMNEEHFHHIKKVLNRKLCSTAHLQQSTPQVDIPFFSGKYSQWPTFFDLFTETIDKNKYLSKAQKMQHLKVKVKGEAERLIQHLNVSAENYETAWDILTHRYNNPQVLFSTQIETFLNQPSIQKQTSYELKRLYDTTTECIHSIQNLGIDTTTWDPILVHLLSKKLDTATYTDYKESRKSPRDLPSFEELMMFLENKFMALEPIQGKEKDNSAFSSSKQLHNHPKNQNRNYYQREKGYEKRTPFFGKYQAMATHTDRCPLCDFDHNLYKCKRFLNQTPDAKMRTIAKLKICQNCLYKHYDTKCISAKRCKECNANHNTLIHDAYAQVPSTSTPLGQATESPTEQRKVNYVAGENEEILLTTISLKIKAADGTYLNLRALLDQGSQISLISENAAQMLGLKRQHYQASISGIGPVPKQSKGLVSIECQSCYNDYQFTTQALVVSRVISNLPNATFRKQSWPHLLHTRLADPDFNISKPIDLLLDASVYSDIIMNGLVKGPAQAPIAQQTKLGWILSGNVKTFSCNAVLHNLEEIAKFWEVEDVTSTPPELSLEDEYCEDYYQSTTRRLESGRYEVALPMKPNFQEKIGTSRLKAVAQFIQQEKKMTKNNLLSESYKKFMRDYEELGHMKQVKPESNKQACYLPHHGVLKLDSTTTALRVVFNGSSKTSSGSSLNDYMYGGPNLQQDLQSLILNWRQYKYVITADIEKMFRQINIRSADQHLQSIVWRDSPRDPLKEYHLTTITYGTKAAPFLAMRTLKQIGRDNADKYILAASALESSFYMDDLLGGSNSIATARLLKQELIDVLKAAGMNLRKWSSNEPKIIEDLQSEQLNTPLEFKDKESRKTLGLQWSPITDMFTFNNRIESVDSKPPTKRNFLSNISKVYDPLGWISPLTIRAKILFQQTWMESLSWDDELPANILSEWMKLREDLKNIAIFSIPRYFGHTKSIIQIHGFCDASKKAYACAIYIIANNDKGEYTSRLVIAKTKVAPVKKPTTLPRLELLGALLLAQSIKKLRQILTTKDIKVNAWTDSMVVLGWLHGETSKWKEFVASRVRKILEVIPAANWQHVKSSDNAADCATRGMTSAELSAHKLWWEGPEWLIKFNPSHNTTTVYQSPTIEVKKSSVHAALYQSEQSHIMELLNKNSSITKAVRTAAWISRFVARLRNKGADYGSALTVNELQVAYDLIIKHAQSIEFKEDINSIKAKGHVGSSSRLSFLSPFLDEHGVLRVGGRLEKANLSYSAKHPAILSSNSRLTYLIIQQAHVTTLHGGPRITLSFIREKFWILSGIRTVKKQLRQCVKCRRYSQDRSQQLMADLPKLRVNPSRPFTNVGVDFTGHIEIKANKGRGIKTSKGYIAVFVCMATKAVHLELVSDLSTASFLAAFRRMCARRGTPKNIYSDNGTNFIGASRLLKREYQEIMQLIDPDVINDLSDIEVTWHFNAPSWPNAGGLWEAAVKSLKYHLKRIIGEQKLTYEEFTTMLYQIEACLNSRPLCAVTENPDDYYLTPGHFLIGGPLLSRPQTSPDHINLSARWQLVQSINQQFWKKWSSEYLQHLQARSKWRIPTKNLELNDVVIIKEENMPPGKWAMARVVALHPGADGHVRVVSVKTQTNTLKRPINKLILLPVNSASDSDTQQNSAKNSALSLGQPGPASDTTQRHRRHQRPAKH